MPVPFQSELKPCSCESRVSQELTASDVLILEKLLIKKGYRENLGSGSFGVAYELDNNIVAKLTTHNREYENALIQKNIQFNRLVKVLGASVLKDNVYLILTEKLTPLVGSEAKLYDKVFNELNSFNLDINKISSDFGISYEFVWKVNEFLEQLYNIKSFMNLASDATSNNVGIKDNDFVLLDLGTF
jgi:hypothetical protein